MEKEATNISNSSPWLNAKYCIVCGSYIVNSTCKCSSGPKIFKLPIPAECEDFFWMDGSVKADLVYLQNTKAYENRKF